MKLEDYMTGISMTTVRHEMLLEFSTWDTLEDLSIDSEDNIKTDI